MDSDISDWTLITDAAPKRKVSPKAVPIFVSQSVPSLQQPLKRGGKPVPEFRRPEVLTAPSFPQRMESGPQLGTEPDVTVLEIGSKRKSSIFKPISAPQGKRSVTHKPDSSTISADLLARWMIVVNSVGPLSEVWQQYHMSMQFEIHCRRLIERFAPSTLFRYISTLQGVFSILMDFNRTWVDIGSHHLSDLLQIAHEGRSSDWGFGATTAVKALRWAQKLLLIHAWQSLYDPIVNSFFNPGTHERRESIPFSLYLVMHWERRLLMKDCSLQEQILLGGFLCLLWGGLRFADGQRIHLQSLSWCITALRGSCFKTKTSKSGQPWAIQSRGFLSHGDWSWVAQCLTALDSLWGASANAPTDADFLLPMTHEQSFSYPYY